MRAGACAALCALLLSGCAFHFQAWPLEVSVSAGDAYVLECSEPQGEGDCQGREVRGGQGSGPFFAAVGHLVDTVAGFFGRGPAPEVNVTVEREPADE